MKKTKENIKQPRITKLVIVYYIVLVLTAMIGVGGILLIKSDNQDLNNLKSKYSNQQYIIDVALDNPAELITSAPTLGMKFDEVSEYYSVEYALHTEPTEYIKQKTFAVYTYEEALEICESGFIEIALCDVELNEGVLTASLDLKNVPLNRTGDHMVCMNNLTNAILITAVGWICFLAISIVLMFFTIKANARRKATIKLIAENSWTCEYCLKSNLNKYDVCAQCGANKKPLKKRKK